MSLVVWAGVGGRDEKPNEHGISHLLEHMAFKGTTKRSSREIVEEIEAVGGDLNAGTSTETTAYYARVMKADVPLALDVLSDILANPSFVPDELEREKARQRRADTPPPPATELTGGPPPAPPAFPARGPGRSRPRPRGNGPSRATGSSNQVTPERSRRTCRAPSRSRRP